jgi:LPS export ABC transporter protein LptC
MKRYHYVILLISTLMFSQVFFSGCGRKSIEVVQETETVPDQAIEQFTATETQSGKVHWILESVYAQIIESRKEAALKAPVIKFFTAGKYTSTLKAEKGHVNMDTFAIYTEGNCLLDTAKGESLKTTNLRYLPDTQKIVTDEYVTLVKDGSVVNGKGLEATPDLETITIKEQTTEIEGK